MANKPVINFKKLTRQQLLVGLLLVVAVGVLIFWKNSSNSPEALQSSANTDRPHWAHATLPFELPLVNMTSGNWRKHINLITGKWEQAGVMKFTLIKGSTKQFCDMFSHGMKICSYSANDGYTAGAVFVTGPNNPHILGSTIRLNDFYYFGRRQALNSDAWRNRDLCSMMGFTLGIYNRGDTTTEVTSCMDVNVTSENVALRQFPDSIDLGELKSIHSHIDDNSSSGIGYKIDSANQKFSQKQYGTLSSTFDNGLGEVYKQDLGDGYEMTSVMLKAK